MEQGRDASPAFDPDALATVLRSRGVPVRGVLSVSRVGHGQSNLTYLATDEAGLSLIVRRPPRGVLLASAHDVHREARILSALDGTPVPAPRVMLSTADPAVSDAPVVVMEHVAGVVIDTTHLAQSLTAGVRTAVGHEMAQTLSAIHDVDLTAVGLEGFASHSPYAQRQLRRWSSQWELAKTRELPALDAMTAMLTRRVPSSHTTSLVHGDFHVRNLIIDGTSGRIRAVLDWELATLGEPLADLGTMLAYWGEGLDPLTGSFDGTRLHGFATTDDVKATYLEASDRPDQDIDYWHALALWKIAIIAEGVVRRARDEPSNAAQGGAPEPSMVDRLIDRAWEVAHRSGLEGPGRSARAAPSW